MLGVLPHDGLYTTPSGFSRSSTEELGGKLEKEREKLVRMGIRSLCRLAYTTLSKCGMFHVLCFPLRYCIYHFTNKDDLKL